MEKLLAGIDIGGTNTVLGFLDKNQNYLFGSSITTDAGEPVEKFITRLVNEIRSILKNNLYEYRLDGIGFAAPCANYFKGTIDNPSNFSWGKVNFIDIMKNHFDIPLAIINDANAAALGEHKFGSAIGMNNFVLISLGTGLGSGIIIDNNLLNGSHGHAGEIGHTIVMQEGRECNCGRKGCLETYVSASGIKRTIFHLLGYSNVNSKLRDVSFNELNGEIISDLADKGDPIALSAFNFTGELLGKALANVVAFYEPEAIVLFGGLANSGELLLRPVRSSFNNNLLSVYSGNVKIIKSSLKDGMAAILGACSLIIGEINKSR